MRSSCKKFEFVKSGEISSTFTTRSAISFADLGVQVSSPPDIRPVHMMIVLRHRSRDEKLISHPFLLHLFRRPPPQRVAQAMPILLVTAKSILFTLIRCELELHAVELGHIDDAIETILCDKRIHVLRKTRLLVLETASFGKIVVQSSFQITLLLVGVIEPLHAYAIFNAGETEDDVDRLELGEYGD